MSDVQSCPACGHRSPDKSFHHGIRICKACSVFYSRRLSQRGVPPCVDDRRLCDLGAPMRLSCRRCRFNRILELIRALTTTVSLHRALPSALMADEVNYPQITNACRLLREYDRRKVTKYPLSEKLYGTSEEGDLFYTYDFHFEVFHYERRELERFVREMPELRTLSGQKVDNLIESLLPFYMSFAHGLTSAQLSRYCPDRSNPTRLFITPNAYIDAPKEKPAKEGEENRLSRFVESSKLVKNVHVATFAKTLAFNMTQTKEVFADKILEYVSDRVEIAALRSMLVYSNITKLLDPQTNAFRRVSCSMNKLVREFAQLTIKRSDERLPMVKDKMDNVKSLLDRSTIASNEYEKLRITGVLLLKDETPVWPPIPLKQRKTPF